MIPCPDPIAHPIIGNCPNVCCHLGGAGRNAFSCGMKTAGFTFAPFKRSVARRDVGFSCADVVMVCTCDCDCRGATGAGGARSSGPSSRGNEPLGKRGTAVDRGRVIGAAVVAVADDAVVDVSGTVLEVPVCGEDMREIAPPIWARRGRSPP